MPGDIDRLPAPPRCFDWQQQGQALARFVADLVADEVAHLRPGGAALPPGPWPADMAIGETGLGLDSLERMSVASALNEALHLHESGVEDLLLARPTWGDWLAIAARGLRHFDAQLSFRTSGSSGVPKTCTHALAELEQEVQGLAAIFASAHPAPARIVSAVPAHHIYGFLFTVLLPAHLGGLPVLDARGVPAASLPRRLQAGDLLVSHPAHWGLLARHGGALPAGVVGSTSTAPCPPDVAQAALERGLQRLVQVYGSSETAGIGWRDAAAAPYTLMPHWSRLADDEAQLLRTAPDGSRRRVALQDRLQWAADGRFSVAGRLDHAVQVGGINVFPQRVAELLMQHPEVAQAAVRLMTAAEGERLKAYIVPAPGADAPTLAARLESWTTTRLSTAERPRAYTLGPALPVNERGKACDWPLLPA